MKDSFLSTLVCLLFELLKQCYGAILSFKSWGNGCRAVLLPKVTQPQVADWGLTSALFNSQGQTPYISPTFPKAKEERWGEKSGVDWGQSTDPKTMQGLGKTVTERVMQVKIFYEPVVLWNGDVKMTLKYMNLNSKREIWIKVTLGESLAYGSYS